MLLRRADFRRPPPPAGFERRIHAAIGAAHWQPAPDRIWRMLEVAPPEVKAFGRRSL